LNSGNGLSDGKSPAAYETGWSTSYASNVDTSNTARQVGQTYATWTSAVGSNETKPINYVSWYEAYAFCIWDDAFLPSQTEWNMAQIGGDSQRAYPWGSTVPGSNANLAVYGCYYNGTGTCSGLTNIGNVGAVPAGNGRWGHANLVGNIAEWVYDSSPDLDPPTSCTDCAVFPEVAWYALSWGANYQSASSSLDDQFGQIYPFTLRSASFGFRCARVP
jgi:formylglycine-generating enzyme required for sulfatase activity